MHERLIIEAIRISVEKGLSQAEWCRQAGFDEFGKLVSNTIRRGDCKLKTFVQLLKPLGCKLAIITDDSEREKVGNVVN